MNRCLLFGAWLALTAVSNAALSQGQRTLELRVIDSVTGAPVEHADVRVIKTVKDDGGWGTHVATDAAGRVTVRVPAHEHLFMVVHRLGFASTALQVAQADSDDVMFVALAPAALRLPASITMAASAIRQLTAAGFYQRQRANAGIFLDSAAIAAVKPLDLLAVLRPYLKNRCAVAYVDGFLMYDIRDVDVRQVVGMEYYASNAQAPPEFPNPVDSEHRCATFLIWQRK